MKYDFCGYATRSNVLCSDGRTIMKDAFKDDDGKRVPLVWNHQHDEPANVLGHAILENREDGVYAYATFNDTESGQNARKLIEHGDISALSIYANKLKEHAGKVMHGIIREVSLVMAGANPMAMIDSYVAHSDEVVEDRTQGWFYSGVDGELYHADSSDKDDDEDEDEDEKKSKGSGKTVGEVLDSFTDEQKVVVMAMLEEALKNQASSDGEAKHSDDYEEDDEEDNSMKHNVFDKGTQNDAVLSHSDEQKILDMAKRDNCGSLKAAIKSFCEDESLAHGFDTESLTLMFPEYKDLKPGAPEMLTDDQGWITKVLQKVHKSPIARIRTRFTDIREIEELRAKGYVTGTEKTPTGDVTVLYRTTDPQTVYVFSQLDRDDILDITDFDYVAYMYQIDRMMLNEELATAILLGDGRAVGNQYKIGEDKIRPVWIDDELFTIHRTVDFAAMRAELQGTGTSTYFGDNYIYAETLVQELLYGRETAKNVGQGDLFIAPHVLNQMLLARDRNGRRIYNTVEELRSALNVNSIITVEQFEGKTRTVTENSQSVTKNLLGILYNLNNYHLGAVKGGEITHFTDFDIKFNKQQSLLETRCSGANVRPLSALVLEENAE